MFPIKFTLSSVCMLVAAGIWGWYAPNIWLGLLGAVVIGFLWARMESSNEN